MHLDELTRPELIFPELPGADIHTVLRALADRMEGRGLVSDADDLYRRLDEREQLGSTGIGRGVAIPHCKAQGIGEVVLAIGISGKGVDFDAADGQPVRLFFLIISPQQKPTAHLHALSAVSKWVKADDHVERILALRDGQAIFDLLRTETAE